MHSHVVKGLVIQQNISFSVNLVVGIDKDFIFVIPLFRIKSDELQSSA